jgi:hypothetical protein
MGKERRAGIKRDLDRTLTELGNGLDVGVLE